MHLKPLSITVSKEKKTKRRKFFSARGMLVKMAVSIGNQTIALCINTRLSGDVSLCALKKILSTDVYDLLALADQLSLRFKRVLNPNFRPFTVVLN